MRLFEVLALIGLIMGTFGCLCGLEFKKPNEAELHLDAVQKISMAGIDGLGGFHTIFKNSLMDRFWSLNLMYYLSFLSGATINSIVLIPNLLNRFVWALYWRSCFGKRNEKRNDRGCILLLYPTNATKMAYTFRSG